jgi:hypothetical protein
MLEKDDRTLGRWIIELSFHAVTMRELGSMTQMKRPIMTDDINSAKNFSD